MEKKWPDGTLKKFMRVTFLFKCQLGRAKEGHFAFSIETFLCFVPNTPVEGTFESLFVFLCGKINNQTGVRDKISHVCVTHPEVN